MLTLIARMIEWCLPYYSPSSLSQDPESLYLVMDFHPGGDLLTVMERHEGGMKEEDAR